MLAHAFAGLFVALKYAGAAYLLYVAWRMATAPAAVGEAAPSRLARLARFFRLAVADARQSEGDDLLPVDHAARRRRPDDDAKRLAELAGALRRRHVRDARGYALAANRARALLRSTRAMRFARRAAGGVMAGVAVTSRRGEPMSDLLAIGEALVELNQPRDGAPFVQGFGGDTSNAMIAAARLGADAAYFTAVGADRFGQALTELWLREGVDASRIVVNGGAHTGLYFVTHGPDGHAFSYLRAGSAASRIGEADLPVDRIRETKILHLSGISQAISSSAADAVVRRNRHRPRRRSARLLRSEPEAQALAVAPRSGGHPRGDALVRHRAARPRRRARLDGLERSRRDRDFYLRLGARLVVLKLGKAGALAANAKARERIVARMVAAVDATGAGDCFDGAFLAEFVRAADPFAAARFANVAASLSTLGYGAVAPLPRRADVEAALARAP